MRQRYIMIALLLRVSNSLSDITTHGYNEGMGQSRWCHYKHPQLYYAYISTGISQRNFIFVCEIVSTLVIFRLMNSTILFVIVNVDSNFCL